MKFVLDQSTDARLLPVLREHGHDATRIGSDYPPGLTDLEVLAIAAREQRILITDDSDFGDLVFHHLHPHNGVVYLRLGPDADLATKTERLTDVLSRYPEMTGRFLVVTRDRIRVR